MLPYTSISENTFLRTVPCRPTCCTPSIHRIPHDFSPQFFGSGLPCASYDKPRTRNSRHGTWAWSRNGTLLPRPACLVLACFAAVSHPLRAVIPRFPPRIFASHCTLYRFLRNSARIPAPAHVHGRVRKVRTQRPECALCALLPGRVCSGVVRQRAGGGADSPCRGFSVCGIKCGGVRKPGGRRGAASPRAAPPRVPTNAPQRRHTPHFDAFRAVKHMFTTATRVQHSISPHPANFLDTGTLFAPKIGRGQFGMPPSPLSPSARKRYPTP